jgi:hypothetical protein
MPTPIQKWKCNKCGSEYQDFTNASLCELLPVPDNPYPAGSFLQFEDESTLFASRYSYCTKGGTVLRCDLMLEVDAETKHTWRWLVDGGHVEYMVAYAQTEFGFKYVSLAEWKYKPGFAASLPPN